MNIPELDHNNEATRRLEVVAAALNSASADLMMIIANMQEAMAAAGVKPVMPTPAENTNKPKPKGP